ncbi:hypothetical protein [Chitinophaga sp. OAE865]|uniref:hypothetical protein n=1 Tax=Chitinophaga sp. OAE865 TaxID=2817898 RepID=UPI001AEA7DAB
MNTITHYPLTVRKYSPACGKRCANIYRPGFREEMTYGMPGFVVPHSLYPQGYRTDPEL